MSIYNAIGIHNMWGFSPSLNLLPTSKQNDRKETKPINVLLLQPSDPRHIIQTIAAFNNKKHHGKDGIFRDRQIHFYVVENSMEIIARHLLLLHICLDWEIPIRQRATMYLEIFGNFLIQDRSAKYVIDTGRDLIKYICDDESGDEMINLLHQVLEINHLKFKEKDDLEFIFQSWSSRKKTSAILDADDDNLEYLRDYRLRSFYGERYDNRKGVIDWDYHTQVKDVASIIHASQYQAWRLNGVAFEFGDATYNMINQTFASFTEGFLQKGKDRGRKKLIKGYWLDLVVSPFIALGVNVARNTDRDDDEQESIKDLFYILNKGTGAAQHRHHSAEVAMFNILGTFWEIQTGERYKMRRRHDIFSGLGEDECNIQYKNKIDSKFKSNSDSKSEKDKKKAFIRNKIKIFPLGKNLESFPSKDKFKEKFDVVFMSYQAFPKNEFASSVLNPMIKHGADIVVETAEYIFPVKNESKMNVISKWKELGRDLGWNQKMNCSDSSCPGTILFQKA